MSNSLPVHMIDAITPFHNEAVSADMPLSAWTLTSLMASQNALYEYLADRAVFGNEGQTQAGHAHGRSTNDGLYIRRHGALSLGHLYPQSTASTSFQAIRFELFNTGGVLNGVETAAARITTTTPALHLHHDYTSLRFSLLAKATSGEEAVVKASLLSDGTTLASDETSTFATSYTLLQLEIPISASDDFDGWLNLKLEFKSTGGASVFVAGDDVIFKPGDNDVLNGLGLLMGESS